MEISNQKRKDKKGGNITMKQKQQRGLLSLIFLGGLAWSSGKIDVKTASFKEVKEMKDGKETTKMVPALKVLPGEEVIFEISYKNIGKEAATNVVVSNPVPDHMIYKSLEANSEGKGEVSVDKGKSWGDFAALKFTDKLRKARAAQPTDVTHVRWKVAKALQPNEEGKVWLRAILK